MRLQTVPRTTASPPCGGEGAYVADVYRRYCRSLCAYVARKYSGGGHDPEEVVQAAFMRFASLAHPREIANPRAWLARCAANIVLSQYRHEKVCACAHADLGRAAREEQLSDFSPERVLLGRERLALLEQVVAAMPPMRRRVFLLVRAEGMRCAEVAGLVGITERAVYQHVFRAVKDIETALEASETAGEPAGAGGVDLRAQRSDRADAVAAVA